MRAQRTEWHEPDAQLFERRQDFTLGLTPPQGILFSNLNPNFVAIAT